MSGSLTPIEPAIVTSQTNLGNNIPYSSLAVSPPPTPQLIWAPEPSIAGPTPLSQFSSGGVIGDNGMSIGEQVGELSVPMFTGLSTAILAGSAGLGAGAAITASVLYDPNTPLAGALTTTYVPTDGLAAPMTDPYGAGGGGGG